MGRKSFFKKFLLSVACMFCISAGAEELKIPLPQITDAISEFKPLQTVYVSPAGNDGNSGLSQEKALRTISKAAKIVKPGTLVLVSGGVYKERISLTVPGTKENPIVFRAIPGETPIVTWGEKIGKWEKMPGENNAYCASLDKKPLFVWENSTVSIYKEAGDTATVEALPGTYAYDANSKKLILNPLKKTSPDKAEIIAVERLVEQKTGWWFYLDEIYGFGLLSPFNRVEGFTFSYVPIGALINKEKTRGCIVRNCIAYGCLGGIAAYDGTYNVIRENICFRNNSHGILLNGSTKRKTGEVLVINNILIDNGPSGIFEFGSIRGFPFDLAVYGYVNNPSVLANLIIHRRNTGYGLMRYKHGEGNRRTCNNILINDNKKLCSNGAVFLDGMSEIFNNTVIGGDLKDYKFPHDTADKKAMEKYKIQADNNLYLPHNEMEKTGFANTLRYDYRLLQGSPAIGNGAFPEPADILYVAPNGNENNAGCVSSTPLASIRKALEKAKVGTTVYILPGTYDENLIITCPATEKNPLCIKSYIPESNVILNGVTEIKNSSYLLLDGLTFRNPGNCPLQISESENITLSKNIITDSKRALEIKKSGPLYLLNNTFASCGNAVNASGLTETLVLRNNVFYNITGDALKTDSPKAILSERNFFLDKNATEKLGTWKKADYRGHHPSTVMDATLDKEYRPDLPSMNFAGLSHEPAGARKIAEKVSPVELKDFKAAAIQPTRAVISWQTPYSYPDCNIQCYDSNGKLVSENKIPQRPQVLKSSFMYGIHNLGTGKEYIVKLKLTYPLGEKEPVEQSIRFKTPLSTREAATLYVSPSGNDSNDGFSKEKSLKTLAAASLRAVPGDTIIAAPGIYRETLNVWFGGISEEKPLVIRSEIPNKAVIDSDYLRENVFIAASVDNFVIDGFNFRGYWFDWGFWGGIIDNCRNVKILNNIFEPPVAPGWSCLLLQIENSGNILLKNNIFINAGSGIVTSKVRNIVIDHNTFHRGGWESISIDCPKDALWKVTNNIFYDVTNPDKSNPAVRASSISPECVFDYNLFCRKNAPKMSLFQKTLTHYGDNIRAFEIKELQEKFKFGSHCIMAEPLFENLEIFDFRLKENSPGKKMANDGMDIGWNPVSK